MPAQPYAEHSQASPAARIREPERARPALLYVLYAVGIGYGFGDAIHDAAGPLSHVALAGIFALTLVIAASRIFRPRRAATDALAAGV